MNIIQYIKHLKAEIKSVNNILTKYPAYYSENKEYFDKYLKQQQDKLQEAKDKLQAVRNYVQNDRIRKI